jgi:hypothetical protein
MVPVVTVLVVVSWVPMPIVTVVCADAALAQRNDQGNAKQSVAARIAGTE